MFPIMTHRRKMFLFSKKRIVIHTTEIGLYFICHQVLRNVFKMGHRIHKVKNRNLTIMEMWSSKMGIGIWTWEWEGGCPFATAPCALRLIRHVLMFLYTGPAQLIGKILRIAWYYLSPLSSFYPSLLHLWDKIALIYFIIK